MYNYTDQQSAKVSAFYFNIPLCRTATAQGSKLMLANLQNASDF